MAMQSLLLISVLLVAPIWAYNEDGSCGAPNYSCPQHSPCCSKFGYCGATEWHCAPKNCLANCWPSDVNPGPDWTEKTQAEQQKQLVDEETKTDEDLTPSQIGVYRQWRHFPEESFGVYVRCIDPGVVALTFDDGPSAYTPKLLKTLKDENVKATFFVLARHLDPTFSGHWQRNQQTLRDIVRQGHVLGSHSYNHPNFVQAGSWATEQDMKKADDLFKKILGFSPRFMRPPEGAINADIAQTLHRSGYYIINWNHDTNDWRHVKSTPMRSLRYVKSRVPNKSLPQADSVILLQHDTYENTVKIQGDLIKILKSKGYRFVTMDECIGVSKPYRA